MGWDFMFYLILSAIKDFQALFKVKRAAKNEKSFLISKF